MHVKEILTNYKLTIKYLKRGNLQSVYMLYAAYDKLLLVFVLLPYPQWVLLNLLLLFLSADGAAVLAEPLLQRGLRQDPRQTPVEPAVCQPLSNPSDDQRQARPALEGLASYQPRQKSLKRFEAATVTHSNTWSPSTTGAHENRKMKADKDKTD